MSASSRTTSVGPHHSASLDAVIVGAGFSGLYMLHRLRGLGLTAKIFEAGSGLGGTWFWNRYPGARCDVESLQYSYSFSDELADDWKWSERYSAQPEILRYLNHVAERFDLRRDIKFDTRVTSAVFDEGKGLWTITTNTGESVTARFCVMATGCLSSPKVPDVPGADRFKGKAYHTTDWPRDGVDFSGQKVGVIGTGSTAVQAIPLIAKEAAELVVFQRTPNFSVPAHNHQLTPETIHDWNKNRAENMRVARGTGFALLIDESTKLAMDVSPDERETTYEERWDRGGFNIVGSYADIVISKEANETAADFVRDKIREIVTDPETAEKLLPKDYPLGTKRICVDTGYYATFNRKNVKLVDLRATPIETITADGIRTSDREYKLDSIVFATGFDAMTGTLAKIDIRGRRGLSLKAKWEGGPRTYLGLMVAGFPNLFIITGPGSPSVLSNMIRSIEQHVDWISDCLTYLRDRQRKTIEATAEAENNWVAHVNEVANTTLFPLANSWYVGANVPGKPRVFMPYIGGFALYTQACNDIAAKGYEGFAVDAASA